MNNIALEAGMPWHRNALPALAGRLWTQVSSAIRQLFCIGAHLPDQSLFTSHPSRNASRGFFRSRPAAGYFSQPRTCAGRLCHGRGRSVAAAGVVACRRLCLAGGAGAGLPGRPVPAQGDGTLSGLADFVDGRAAGLWPDGLARWRFSIGGAEPVARRPRHRRDRHGAGHAAVQRGRAALSAGRRVGAAGWPAGGAAAAAHAGLVCGLCTARNQKHIARKH